MDKNKKIIQDMAEIEFKKYPEAEETKISRATVGNLLFDTEASATGHSRFVSQGTLKAFHLMVHSKV